MKIWAVVQADGTPCIGVWSTVRSLAQLHMEDRKANGQAFEGERLVWFANLDTYNATLTKYNLPLVGKVW